jgi:hypothetical protein
MRVVNPTTLAALIAAVASLAAAGTSLWSSRQAAKSAATTAQASAQLTAELGDASKRQEWRRQYVLPVVEDVLTREKGVSKRLQDLGQQICEPENHSNRTPLIAEAESIRAEIERVRGAVVRLELTASPDVCMAAKDLLLDGLHQKYAKIRLCLDMDEYPPDKRIRRALDILSLPWKERAKLIEAMRSDLGLPD